MTDDLVARLREHITAQEWPTLQDKAADEITKLRADLAAEREGRLKAELFAVNEKKAHGLTRSDLAAARARIVELCACLEDARPYVLDAAKNTEEIARIDAALGVTASPDAH